MAKMAKTIDSFTQNQTRLVVIIDGLDSCEQDKVLQMLDTVRSPGLLLLKAFELSNLSKHFFRR